MVEDTQVIAKILVSLPPSLEYFLSAWDSTPQDMKTLSSLTNRLVKAENLRNRTKEDRVEQGDAAYLGSSHQSSYAAMADPRAQHFSQGVKPPLGGYPGLRGHYNGLNHQHGRGGYRGRGGHHQRGGYHPYSSENRRQSFNQNGSSREDYPQSHVSCYHCGEPGHTQRKCRHLKKGKGSQQGRDRNTTQEQRQSYSYKSSICFNARR